MPCRRSRFSSAAASWLPTKMHRSNSCATFKSGSVSTTNCPGPDRTTVTTERSLDFFSANPLLNDKPLQRVEQGGKGGGGGGTGGGSKAGLCSRLACWFWLAVGLVLVFGASGVTATDKSVWM